MFTTVVVVCLRGKNREAHSSYPWLIAVKTKHPSNNDQTSIDMVHNINGFEWT
jgi:hypothetical protein